MALGYPGAVVVVRPARVFLTGYPRQKVSSELHLYPVGFS